MFSQTASSSKREQYNFCTVVVEQNNALLGGIWWQEFIGKLANLKHLISHYCDLSLS